MKFYFKLAASNLKADRRLFVPFVTTTSFLMAVNLIMLNAYASSDVLFKSWGQPLASHCSCSAQMSS